MRHPGSTTHIRRQAPTEISGQSPAASPAVATTEHGRDLDERIRSVGSGLGRRNTSTDLRRTSAVLDRIADIVRTGGTDLTADDYARLLQNLTRVYSRADAGHEVDDFAATASGYARVVKALSRRCPECDYREAIGQLLDLMAHLFQTRNPSWKSIFRLLRAIPESVNGRERLQRVCSMYVREWFDPGVPNLYSLQKQLHREIEELDLEIETLRSEIRTIEEELETLQTSSGMLGNPKVAILAVRRKQGQIVLSQRNMLNSVDGRDAKTKAAALIKSDIRDLGNRLRKAGRTYRVHLVFTRHE